MKHQAFNALVELLGCSLIRVDRILEIRAHFTVLMLYMWQLSLQET